MEKKDLPQMPKNLANSANQWLSGHGVISDVTINLVLASIQDTFDYINHVDMTIDNDEGHVIIEVYVPFLEWILHRTSKIFKFSKEVAGTYIQKHTVEIIIKRHKGPYNLSKTSKRNIRRLLLVVTLITAGYFGQKYKIFPNYAKLKEKIGIFNDDRESTNNTRENREGVNKKTPKKK